jgi:hypothetical protein
MRQRLALWGALSLMLALGCTPVEKVASTSWLPRRRPFQGPTGPDVVQMRIAFVEVRPGEADWKYINGDLWQLADESLIDEDRREIMDESGFRVGKLGTQPPPTLLALLTSKRSNPAPCDFTFRTGDPKPLTVGPTQAHCRYRVEREGNWVELDQADCRFIVSASHGSDGKTLLHVSPEVVHGDAKSTYGVDEHAGSFVSRQERPVETYPQMGWEAELALNEYLIVGGNYEGVESLGHQFFVRPDEPEPVQRLLVIQMGAGPPETPPANPAQPAGSGRKPRATPLALQTAGGATP